MSNKANQESICTNGTLNILQSPQGAENRAGTQTLVDTSAEQKGRDLYIQAESCHDRAAPPAEQQAPVQVSTQWLAEMIMSDCGCSTQNQRLLDRIIERITQYESANTTPQPAPATQQAGDVVAYLDVGAGGYLDLGSELSEDALQQLPKGRHALVIAGTYGIDGYVAAPQPSPTTQPAPQPSPAAQEGKSHGK